MADRFSNIFESLASGQRLAPADYLELYEHADFHSLCLAAHRLRTSLHNSSVFYISNAHLNYTDCCVNTCPVCAFSRRPGDPSGKTVSLGEITDLAAALAARGINEIHVVGGLNPDLPLDYYLSLLSILRSHLPSASIKAFTAVEIDFIAGKNSMSADSLLSLFKSAGLDSLPGGGAEIFSPDYRRLYFPQKISASRWLEIHHIAHSLSIPTTATMLYNSGETPAQLVEHLLALRDAQDYSKTHYPASFQCFIPLSCKRPNSGHCRAVNDIRVMALSRLVLDNFTHIKAFVPILGLDVALLSLLSGADDLDNVVDHYRIVENVMPAHARLESLLESVRRLGLTPLRRDGFYNLVTDNDKAS